MSPLRAVLCLLTLVAPRAYGQSPERYFLDVTERSVLEALEEKGLGLGVQLGASKAGAKRGSCADLRANPLYSSLVDTVEGDLRAMEPDLKAAPPATGPGHLFPISWLRSPDTYFELAGIVNRLDRKPFLPDSCGEARLIYRLAYRRTLRGREVFSRLPMTLNLVFEVPRPTSDPSCKSIARRWVGPADQTPGFAWLKNPARIEINLQDERWDPTFRPDLAGHAGYLMRIFRMDRRRKRLQVEPLENTPDVTKLAGDPALRARLLQWLRQPDSLRALDRGTILLPRPFLAARAVSVTPFGLERRANRLFLQLFSPDDFRGVILTGYRTIRSPSALLRRLDGLTCVGCHQSRSMAGFHFLGRDAEIDKGVNAVLDPGSPHFVSELARREKYGAAILEGNVPDEFRPFAERAEEGKGRYGEHCGLGDAGFSRWNCADDLECKPSLLSETDRALGRCLPKVPSLGDPCEVGDLTQDSDPLKDRLVNVKKTGCAPTDLCFPRAIGFPGGMCARACGRVKGAEEVCQGVPALQKFTDCLLGGFTFRECFKTAAGETALRPCDASHPCRDDFTCAQSVSGVGACVPPYFLFQLVITGHQPLR